MLGSGNMPAKKSDKFYIRSSYTDTSESQYGIYVYYRLDTGEIIYVGKDSNIRQHRRHLDHIAPSKRTEQNINRYLQTEGMSEVFGYSVLAIYASEAEMNIAEVMYIMFYKALGQAKMNISVDITPAAYEAIVKGIGKLDLEVK